MKIAYVHNLPLEYYPPAVNTLNFFGRCASVQVCAFTSHNRKGRKVYDNDAICIRRCKLPDPAANRPWRLIVSLWWHLYTAFSLFLFKPNAVVYVEPHSAIAIFLYYRFFRGNARLLIHHHEYYAPEDYLRPGMRLPNIGCRLESSYLFPHAVWISQTNEDRLRFMRERNPDIPSDVWRILPNYPPRDWIPEVDKKKLDLRRRRLRLVYVGSASFQDTYIKEIVEWAAKKPDSRELHISGYNVAEDVLDWLQSKNYSNVTFDPGGYEYCQLPNILKSFDVGLVLYKGNTTNFVYNVPNKVYEYLVCGLSVWYPKEMQGIKNSALDHNNALLEIDFDKLSDLESNQLGSSMSDFSREGQFIAETALTPLMARLGVSEIPLVVADGFD